jgi:hypothetical protein
MKTKFFKGIEVPSVLDLTPETRSTACFVPDTDYFLVPSSTTLQVTPGVYRGNEYAKDLDARAFRIYKRARDNGHSTIKATQILAGWLREGAP